MRRAAFVNINVTGTSNLVGLATLGSGITVTGSSTFSNTTIDGNLLVSGLTTFQNVEIINDFNVQDSINFENDVNIWGEFTISGNAEFNNNLHVGQNLSISGNFALGGDMSIGNLTVTDGMNVTGSSSFNDAVLMDDTLAVNGGASFNSDVNVASALVAGGSIRGTSGLNITGSVSFNDAVLVDDALTVNGAIRGTSGLNVTGSASFNSGVSVASTLVANGASFNSGVSVSGNATFNNGLYATGTVNVDGSLREYNFPVAVNNAYDDVTMVNLDGTTTTESGTGYKTYMVNGYKVGPASTPLVVTGLTTPPTRAVYSNTIDVSGGFLYTTEFPSPAGDQNILQYNISTGSWTTIGVSTSYNYVNSMIVHPTTGDLYVAGTLSLSNGTNIYRFGRWNKASNTWTSLGGAGSGTVYVMRFYTNDIIYLGGNFTTIGGVSSASYFAKYTISTNTFSFVTSSISNSVNYMSINGNKIMLGWLVTGYYRASVYDIVSNSFANYYFLDAVSGDNDSTMTSHGDYFYFVILDNYRQSIYRYSISGNSFTKIATFNPYASISSLSIDSSETYLYISGSFTDIDGASISITARTLLSSISFTAIPSFPAISGGNITGLVSYSNNSLYYLGSFTSPYNYIIYYQPSTESDAKAIITKTGYTFPGGASSITLTGGVSSYVSLFFDPNNNTATIKEPTNPVINIGASGSTNYLNGSYVVNNGITYSNLYLSGKTDSGYNGLHLGYNNTSANLDVKGTALNIRVDSTTGETTRMTIDSTGNVTIAANTTVISSGGLNVTGSASFNGDLTVNGTFTPSGGLSITNLAVPGTLGVTGSASFQGGIIATGGVVVRGGGMNVTGSTSFNSDLIANSTLTVTDVLTVNGAVRATNGLNVTGSASFNSALIANSTLTVTDVLTANGAIRGTSGLHVTGSSSFNGDVIVTSTLISKGLISGSSGLNVTGGSSFNSDVAVAGTLTSSGLFTASTGAIVSTGGLKVQAAGLEVTGTATFNTGLFITGGALIVSNIESLSLTSTINIGNDANTAFVNLACGSNTQVVNIGNNNSTGQTTINIGGVGDIVNISGSMNYISVTNIAIADKTIVLNRNGAASTANGAGLYFEEAGVENAGMLIIRDTSQRDQFEFYTPGNSKTLYTPVISTTSTMLAQPDAGSGTVTISNNLGVTGTTVLYGTLNVTGSASFNSGLTVSGGTIVGFVGLNVTGSSSFNSGLTVTGGTLTASTGLTVSGGAIVGFGGLNVTGSSSFNRGLTVTGGVVFIATTMGIGIDNPRASLHIGNPTDSSRNGVLIQSTLSNSVARPILTTGTNIGNYEIRGYGDTTSYGSNHGFLRLSAGGGSDTTAQASIDIAGFSTVADMNNNIVMRTVGAERLRINNAGNVGIGTSTINSALTVSGSVGISGGLSLSGPMNMTGTMSVSGNVNVSGAITLTGNLLVSGLMSDARANNTYEWKQSANSGTGDKYLLIARMDADSGGGDAGLQIRGLVGGFFRNETGKIDIVINVRGGTSNYVYGSMETESATLATILTFMDFVMYTNGVYRDIYLIQKSGKWFSYDVILNGSNGVILQNPTSTTVTPTGTVSVASILSVLRVYTIGGNVGIGNTSPEALLHVNSIATTGVSTILQSNFNTDNVSSVRRLLIGQSNYRPSIQAQLLSSTWSSTDLILNAISGNVGIGTTTPSQKLAIRGDSTATNKELSVGANYSVSTINDRVGAVSFYSNNVREMARVESCNNSGTADNNSDLRFLTRFDYDNLVERMRIDRNGNIGIATSTPARTLDVSGVAEFGPGNERVVLGVTGIDQQGAFIQWNKNADGASYYINQKGGGGGGFVFAESDTSNALTNRMVIDSAGTVGIGISPAVSGGLRLDVLGRIRARGITGNTSAVLELVNNAGDIGYFYLDNTKNFVIGTANNLNILNKTNITSGGLNVTGSSSFNSGLTVSGGAIIGFTGLNVTGSVSFNNGLTVTGGAIIGFTGLNVTGSVSFNNGLTVTGGNIKVSPTGIAGNYTSYTSLMADNISSGVSILPTQFTIHGCSSSGVITSTKTPIIAGVGGAAGDVGGLYVIAAQFDMWRTFIHLNQGTYTFSLRYGAGADRGIVSLYIDDVSVGTFDTYAGTSDFGYTTISSISIANTGAHKIEYRIDAKRVGPPASSNYVFLWHYAGFTRTA